MRKEEERERKKRSSYDGVGRNRSIGKVQLYVIFSLLLLCNNFNVNAANYVLKYLQKTFDDSGKVRYDGNAWCYWATNSKFYSISEDLEPIEKVVEKIIDLLHGYDAVIRLIECESYEYIGPV